MRADSLAITLKRRTGRGTEPYHRQLFEGLRQAIREGRLRAGDRLPSTRECAALLGLARNTVARAYEDLLAAGYLVGKVGSGTYVSAGVDPGALAGPRPRRTGAPPSRREPAAFPAYDFRPGIPDWEAFPRTVWLRLMGRAMRQRAPELRRYGEPGGHFPLRQALARHLAVSRGVVAEAEQVVIVNGSQQGLDLVARICVQPGDRVALEDPGYPEARDVLSAARPIFIPVDAEGMKVQALERQHAVPRLVYVTPSHQFPTGVTLALARRYSLLEWAEHSGALIVEDDYDSELRLPGLTLESLQGLDRGRRTVYLGTFSTVLFPPFRVGCVVLPPGLVEPFLRAKWLADRQTPTLEQLALNDFLQEGHFERHLRRMRRLVAGRREALRDSLQRCAGDWIRLDPPRGGMHLAARLSLGHGRRDAVDLERRVVDAALSRGVGVYPLGPCWARAPDYPALLLGYAALSEDAITTGVKLLAEELAALSRGPRQRARSLPPGS